MFGNGISDQGLYSFLLFIIDKGVFIFRFFLKSEGKEVKRKRKKMRRDGGGGGLIVNIFLGSEIFSSGVQMFSGGG